MQYTPDGSADADVTVVDVNLEGDRATTSGCEADDFAGFPDRRHRLSIHRGTCPFRQKAQNADRGGSLGGDHLQPGQRRSGDDRFGLFGGTLDPDPQIGDMPVFSMGFDLGAELARAPKVCRSRSISQTHAETINTRNVIADSPTGRADRTVLAGAHLDSVPDGPGINDNGSGSATMLEIAEAMADTTITNQCPLRVLGGEEDGLIGSAYYVSQLGSETSRTSPST